MLFCCETYRSKTPTSWLCCGATFCDRKSSGEETLIPTTWTGKRNPLRSRGWRHTVTLPLHLQVLTTRNESPESGCLRAISSCWASHLLRVDRFVQTTILSVKARRLF